MKVVLSIILTATIWMTYPLSSAGCAASGKRESAELDLKNFDDQFLDSHPEVAADLRRDASLVGSRRYLKEHPGLRYYFADHPALLDEIHRDPKAFMDRENWYRSKDGQRVPARELNELQSVHHVKVENSRSQSC